jgi:hypothetical protein
LLDGLIYQTYDDQLLLQILQDKLGVRIKWTGIDLGSAINNDLSTKCMKYIGEITARAIYDSIDSEFNKQSPQFKVTVKTGTYLYNIKSIVSTTEIGYNMDSEAGSAITTMTSHVELTSGEVKLDETVYFIVLIILMYSLSRCFNMSMEAVLLIMVRLL